jgi:hypothetical protein
LPNRNCWFIKVGQFGAGLIILRDCVEETISTTKFADRAKRVMVRVKANEISATDDALVRKLQKEVQYLKTIIQCSRTGKLDNLHKQLVSLQVNS